MKNVIVCPKCGMEYLPEEIFVPKGFFGKPVDIVRDETGIIEAFNGDSLNTKEKYCCDKCNTLFSINAKVSFSTSFKQETDFSSEHITKI